MYYLVVYGRCNVWKCILNISILRVFGGDFRPHSVTNRSIVSLSMWQEFIITYGMPFNLFLWKELLLVTLLLLMSLIGFLAFIHFIFYYHALFPRIHIILVSLHFSPIFYLINFYLICGSVPNSRMMLSLNKTI